MWGFLATWTYQSRGHVRHSTRLRWLTTSSLGLALVCNAIACVSSSSAAEDGSSGITTPRAFRPFDPDAPSCRQPPGLTKVLAFAQENDRAFLKGVDYGLALAAKNRGLKYQLARADSDPAKQIAQVQGFFTSRVGAVIAAPADPISLSPALQKIIWAGGYVGTVVPPPATTILNAPQYLTGKVLGDSAAAYIRDHLGGKADVVLLTQDSLEFLAPRFVAIRDSLNQLPGVNVIADISPNPVNEEGGRSTMNTILEAHANVDVVLGADTVVLGALKALRAAGKARPDQYIGGIDGEPEAVSTLR